MKNLYRSRCQRNMITASIVSVIVFVWLFLIYFQIQSHIDRYKISLSKTLNRNNIVSLSEKRCKNISLDITKIKKNLKPYHKKKNISHKNISKALSYARKANLTLNACTNSESITKNKWFIENKIRYELTGSMEQVLSFCQNLKNNKDALQCNDITIESDNQKSCNITCSLSFFSLQSA